MRIKRFMILVSITAVTVALSEWQEPSQTNERQASEQQIRTLIRGYRLKVVAAVQCG